VHRPPESVAVGTRRRRRRPSGEPPPLPRDPEWTRWLWAAALVAVLGVALEQYLLHTATSIAVGDKILSSVANIRTAWLTDLTKFFWWLTTAPVVYAIRVAAVLVLIFSKRWRHMVVFLATFVIADWIASRALYVARPMPDVTVLVSGAKPAFPSPPATALAITLMSAGFSLVPAARRPRVRTAVVVLLAVVSFSFIYLAADYLIDVLYGCVLAGAIAAVAFKWLAPDGSFPVSYKRGGNAAHLDLGGKRRDAIIRSVGDQLGLNVAEVKPFGLEGSGGSSPLLMTLEDGSRLFGKIYATSHVRADRWYKIGRTIMYGQLEDEVPFASVRRIVEYEDYALLLLDHIGIRVAKTYGVVELTPDREYMLVTEFFERSQDLGDVQIDETVIDEGLQLIRTLWDAGISHRDIKPANMLVREGHLQLVDVSGVEVRASPWRQAVDLANMMLTLALQSDPDLVYEQAVKYFEPEEIAEAFACAVGMAIPTQLSARLKADPRPLMARFKELAPHADPVSIQRWSFRRLALTAVAAAGVAVMVALFFDSLRAGAV
jgi:tRNA A-37 threonylcarbamoyl transferase component Bud32